ncbi:MAG: hypothetical protein AMXMBFR13_43000 [Phycisphaerae bacterium]
MWPKRPHNQPSPEQVPPDSAGEPYPPETSFGDQAREYEHSGRGHGEGPDGHDPAAFGPSAGSDVDNLTRVPRPESPQPQKGGTRHEPSA